MIAVVWSANVSYICLPPLMIASSTVEVQVKDIIALNAFRQTLREVFRPEKQQG